MSAIAALLDPPEPLPRVPGPKLAPFSPTARADIEFIKELGNPAEDVDGHVWKVKINGMAASYALKMFRFRSAKFLRSTIGHTLTRPLASPDLYIDYLDPFNCECRAYGRLRDENRQDLAVRAHGYLLLTPEQEAEVTERSGGIHFPPPLDPKAYLDSTNPWGRWEEHRGVPVRAIVKQLMTDRQPFRPTQLQAMWHDLEDLHKLGILVRDIGVGNYMGGKLVDFGHSWAMPHPCFEKIHPDQLCEERQSDPLALQGAIVDWGTGQRWDWNKVETPEELWDCASGEGQNDQFGHNPTLYDWRKWEDDPQTLVAHYLHELFGPPRSASA